MKKNKLGKILTVKKETIANLDNELMSNARGGSIQTSRIPTQCLSMHGVCTRVTCKEAICDQPIDSPNFSDDC